VEYKISNNGVLCIKWSRDDRYLICCGEAKDVVVWQLLTGEKFEHFQGQKTVLTSVEVLENNETVFCVGNKEHITEMKREDEDKIYQTGVIIG